MSGLSLWLCPPSDSPLRLLVARLAQSLQTESFLPHLTLVSDEILPSLPIPELLEKVKQGVNKWGSSSLELRFKDVRRGPKYYQCVLAAVHPDEPLVSLHQSIVSQFSLSSPPPPYFPHLSLVYGDLSPTTKEEVIDKLKADADVRELEGDDSVEIVGEKSIKPLEILLCRTSGPCETWEVLEKVSLSA